MRFPAVGALAPLLLVGSGHAMSLTGTVNNATSDESSYWLRFVESSGSMPGPTAAPAGSSQPLIPGASPSASKIPSASSPTVHPTAPPGNVAVPSAAQLPTAVTPSAPGGCLVDVAISCQTATGSSCATIPATPSVQCATNTSLQTLSFTFANATCNNSTNQQPKIAFCSDQNTYNGGDVLVECTSAQGKQLKVSPGIVGLAESFQVSNPLGNSSLPTGLCCILFDIDTALPIQTTCLDTSGSVSLSLGDRFGDLSVEACGNSSCSTDLDFTYTITNGGTTDLNLTKLSERVDGTSMSLLNGTTTLASGQELVLNASRSIDTCISGQLLNLDVDVVGTSPKGRKCNAFANYTATVEPSAAPNPSTSVPMSAPTTLAQPQTPVAATFVPVPSTPTIPGVPSTMVSAFPTFISPGFVHTAVPTPSAPGSGTPVAPTSGSSPAAAPSTSNAVPTSFPPSTPVLPTVATPTSTILPPTQSGVPSSSTPGSPSAVLSGTPTFIPPGFVTSAVPTRLGPGSTSPVALGTPTSVTAPAAITPGSSSAPAQQLPTSTSSDSPSTAPSMVLSLPSSGVTSPAAFGSPSSALSDTPSSVPSTAAGTPLLPTVTSPTMHPAAQPSSQSGGCNVDAKIACQTANGTSCDAIAVTPKQCANGDLATISLLVNLSNCTGSVNKQQGVATCSDDGAYRGGNVLVSCTDTSGNEVGVFPIVVAPGQAFAVENPAGGSLPNETCCTLLNDDGSPVQTTCFDTSGSVSFSLGDKFGDLTVDSCDGRTCSKALDFTYTITNVGTAGLNLTALDASVANIPKSLLNQLNDTSLSSGQKLSLNDSFRIDTCTAGQFSVSIDVGADSLSGSNCSALANYTVVVDSVAPSSAPSQAQNTSLTGTPSAAPPTSTNSSSTQPATPTPATAATSPTTLRAPSINAGLQTQAPGATSPSTARRLRH